MQNRIRIQMTELKDDLTDNNFDICGISGSCLPSGCLYLFAVSEIAYNAGVQCSDASAVTVAVTRSNAISAMGRGAHVPM